MCLFAADAEDEWEHDWQRDGGGTEGLRQPETAGSESEPVARAKHPSQRLGPPQVRTSIHPSIHPKLQFVFLATRGQANVFLGRNQ